MRTWQLTQSQLRSTSTILWTLTIASTRESVKASTVPANTPTEECIGKWRQMKKWIIIK